MKLTKPLSIGVMGSAATEEMSADLIKLAQAVGLSIAQSKHRLLFGIESDSLSLSMVAAKQANNSGGVTIGIAHGDTKTQYPYATIEIVSGLGRGGGREFILVKSCDAIITIGGGSGTLTEIAIAYQSGIPIISLPSSRGWSGKLAGTFLDHRKRVKIQKAATAEEAVKKAVKSVI